MKRHVTVGSRSSRLAVIQAESVLAELRKAHPEFEFSLIKIITEGDRHKSVPLDQVAGRGTFVKEIEKALLDGRIDIAVHSLKDLPTQIPPGLCLAAVTARLDPRDAFVSRGKKLSALMPGSIIGTGSIRRSVQLLAYRPDLKVRAIRGNIETRLRKVWSGELDGVIIAAAAMIRLGCEDKITEYLSVEHFLPEVGQGALGIEIRSEDKEIAELVHVLNDEPTWHSVVAERVFLQTLGGGCRTPITALGTVIGTVLRLEGMIVNGNNFLRASMEGSVSAPENVGRQLAQKMLEMGASPSIAKVRLG